MSDIKDRAREYLVKHSEYRKVCSQTNSYLDTLTAMVDFAEQETKKLKEQIEKMKRCNMCKYSTRLGYCKIRQHGGVCENHDKWEIKENDL